jgi:ankyrin repeat protein
MLRLAPLPLLLACLLVLVPATDHHDEAAHVEEEGCHKLITASAQGNVLSVQNLLASGISADCSCRMRVPGNALMRAISGRHEDTVKMLLSGGANANVRSLGNIPALLLASGGLVGDPHKGITMALLAAGAEPNAQREKGGPNALEMWLTHKGDAQGLDVVVKALRAAGALLPSPSEAEL